MKPQYIEFNGKHPKAKKEDRQYTDKPGRRWACYGCAYSAEFLKLDCDDTDHKTGEVVQTIQGKRKSEILVQILDDMGIKYNGIQTEHGKHFFFRKPAAMQDGNKINWTCPLGIKLEWKFPTSDDHIPLKINGVQRQFFRGSVDNTDIDELPAFLFPLQKRQVFDLTFPKGDRTQSLGAYLFHLVGKGYTAEQAFQIVRIMNKYVFESPIPERSLDAEILNESTFQKLLNSEQATANKKDVTPETFRRFLSDMGMTIQYNELLNIVEYENIPDDMNTVNDLQNQMPTKLQYKFREYTGVKNIGKQQVIDLISLEADENAFNPVKEYLQSAVWDGVDRFTCAGGVFDILGVTDQFEQGLIRKWFYQAAAMPFNTLEQPFQPEGVLILQGKEGIGKTRFFAQLVPVPVWFSSLDKELTTKNKDILIQMLGAWVSEVGEIDRTFKANKSDVKNFMTLRMDSIRKPYAREPVTKARTTVFCGTTNKAEFLNDDTGFRRWWVIPVTKKIEAGAFADAENLRQFWSQCYQEYAKDNNCFRLSAEQIEHLEQANKEVTETIPAEDELRTRLDFDADVIRWQWIRPAIMKELPEYDVVKYSAKEIGAALTAIMKDYPDIKKGRDGRGVKYLIPPVISGTNRYRHG